MKFRLDGKDYSFGEAMKILMKGQPKNADSRGQAYLYLMNKCLVRNCDDRREASVELSTWRTTL